MLYQNPLSVKSTKFSFSRYTTYFISAAENRSFGVWERITNLTFIQSAFAALNVVVLNSIYNFHFKKPSKNAIMHDFETS